MKRELALAMLVLISFNVPADAQRRGTHGGAQINAMQSQLDGRINRGVASGRLNRQEADRLRRMMSEVSSIEARMRASGRGLNRNEQAKLQQRLAQVNAQITKELNDFEGRNEGFWRNQRSSRNR